VKRSTRRWLARGVAALAAAAALGALVLFSGVMPIGASSGHWGVTEWILHTGMRRSVATHSIGIESPVDLDDPALVMRGAGHYEGGCRFCHGSIGTRMPGVTAALTPAPPRLPARVAELDDAELFYFVRHGVKLTGMPAWPSDRRDDEVWAVVAFVRRMPQITQASYRELVFGDTASDAPPPVVRERCARCHGPEGRGRGIGAFPRLAGQAEAYLAQTLVDYADGARHSGIMEPEAAALSHAERRAAARWYASRPRAPAAPALDGASIEAGRAIAMRGVPDEQVAACHDCHGPEPTERAPSYPELGHQWAGFLRDQLRLFADDRRGGGAQAALMRETEPHRLSEDAMRDVASYYAQLPR